MRIKTRPDLHHAPLPDGVYVSAGSGEFALSGWSGFADLLSRCLPLLGRGADEDELVTAFGTEGSRPAIQTLLAQLDAHGMILHLDQLETAELSAPELVRHPELIAYLECRAREPYAALARILSARVLLVGPEAALDVAERALRELGIDGERDPAASRLYDAAVVAMPRELVDQIPPRATSFVPVVVGAGAVLVGPPVHDLRDWDLWRTLVARALDRDGLGLDDAPATAVAVSAAVHLLLQDMAGVPGPAAYVVSGETFTVDALDRPAPARRVPGELTLAEVDDDGGEDLVDTLTRVLHPWTGLGAALDEGSLPQMPVALRRIRLLDGTVLLAVGADQREATVEALLAVSRRHHGGASAGTTSLRWLLDGALQHLATAVGPGSPLVLGAPEARRLQHALTALGDQPRLTVHRLHGLSWSLVRCASPHGHITSAWAATPESAGLDALARAMAVAGHPRFADDLLHRSGTAALTSASTPDVQRLADEVAAWAAAQSLRVSGRTAPADVLLGQSSVHAGPVRLLPVGGPDGDPGGHEPLRADDLVAMVGRLGAAAVVATRGWDPARLRAALEVARSTGGTVVPVQLSVDHVSIGPLWGPDLQVGCPACAELRRRTVLDHVLAADLDTPALPAGTPPATLLAVAMEELVRGPRLAPGEVLHVATEGVSRHRILRLPGCRWCASNPGEEPPAGLDLRDEAVVVGDPTRVLHGSPVLREADLDALVVDARYGPVRGILREEHMPFAMSMAVLAGAPVMGHGRALTYAQTRPVAVLEAYERLAGFPYEAALVLDRSHREVTDRAVDPLSLGRYTAEQLAHPSSRVVPFTPDLALDWVWGVDLASGAARLVPAEIGFYQYEHAFKRDVRASRAARPEDRRRLFLESSSGCALGSSLAEACVHALFEVAERDAFQIAWHRARPLPRIAPVALGDAVVDELIALVESRGYSVHLLVATADIDVPVVWVLAVSRTGGFPATFSSAGSGADPIGAVRSGLREVAQLVCMSVDWTAEQASALVRDPWSVRELEDHVRWSSAPEVFPRVTAVLGGPTVSVREAFPGWPDALRQDGRGILGVLDGLRRRFVEAGLAEVVVVDQSTREHHDLGLHVVKAVVPGSVPMVFGQAHQRLAGIPRLDAALRDLPDRQGRPLDPHPFP